MMELIFKSGKKITSNQTVVDFAPNNPVPVCWVWPNGDAVDVVVLPKSPVFLEPKSELLVFCWEPNNDGADVVVLPKPDDAKYWTCSSTIKNN